MLTLAYLLYVMISFFRNYLNSQGKISREAVPDGPYKGERLDPEKFERMLDDYYRARGWDVNTGIPTKETLLRYGLDDVVEDLVKSGKL